MKFAIFQAILSFTILQYQFFLILRQENRIFLATSSVLWLKICRNSAGPFVISLFSFVKIDLATDSGSEYDRDKKKIGFHFFLHV